LQLKTRVFPSEDATGEGPHFGKSQPSQSLRDARGSDFVRARAVDDDLPISRQGFDTEVKLQHLNGCRTWDAFLPLPVTCGARIHDDRAGLRRAVA
jgi:hypothetical protein